MHVCTFYFLQQTLLYTRTLVAQLEGRLWLYCTCMRMDVWMDVYTHTHTHTHT